MPAGALPYCRPSGARSSGAQAWLRSSNWRNAGDQHRVDALARNLARGLSRRSLLGSLSAVPGVTVLGRQQADAASGGYLAPVQVCADDTQCGDSRYNSRFCDDNGIVCGDADVMTQV